MNPIQADVVIIGAGAAGLMCAIEAGLRGRRVVVLDHARKAAEKIRISGGGRCNFTNLHVSPERYLSQNPRFAVSALSRYPAEAFISLVEKHCIRYHEKTLGQLFCDGSSQEIIGMLLEECKQAQVAIRLQTKVDGVSKPSSHFRVQTSVGEFFCESLVVACGGLSIPKMGATGLGYQIARQFGVSIVPPQPALAPFTLSEAQLALWSTLAGLALDAEVQCGKQQFREGILFTHRGLSGPAMLQISSYWRPTQHLRVNLAPGQEVGNVLRNAKLTHPRRETVNVLSKFLPRRLAQHLAEQHFQGVGSTCLSGVSDRQLAQLGLAVNRWEITPHGTEGYRTAEVTLGGVDTADLSSKTMMSRKIENLFFVGEVVDVTGHLGGFNFQWAWASGWVAGQYA